MKTFNYLVILIVSFFIKTQTNSNNTILLEIKTWNHTQDENSNNYININPHIINKIKGKNSTFDNFDLILNDIYTEFSIGTPSENMLGFFSGKLNEFKVFYYNETESETFKKISSKRDKIEKYTDNFVFKYQNTTYEINEMEFVKTEFSPISLNFSHSFFGLQMSPKDIVKMKKYDKHNHNNQKNNQKILNFVESLKKAQSKELNINNYYWTIKYFNQTNNTLENNVNGVFYFGEPPHIYDPTNYNKENFIEINSEAGHDNLCWGLTFNNIDFINKTTNKVIPSGRFSSMEYSLIYPEVNYFITTQRFFTRIQRVFFNKFINRKKDQDNNSSSICHERVVSLVDNFNLPSIKNNHNELNSIYNIIYCNKTKIIEYGEELFYNEFPTIKFDHPLLGYSFEFDANDLFYEKEDEVHFLMASKIDRGDKWIFGKAFMKKYQIVFNNDKRTIGFYLNTTRKKIKKPRNIFNYMEADNNSNYYLIIFIIIFMAISLFLIRKFCIKNKLWIYKDITTAKVLESINTSKEQFLIKYS